MHGFVCICDCWCFEVLNITWVYLLDVCNETPWKRCHGHLAPYVRTAVKIDAGRATVNWFESSRSETIIRFLISICSWIFFIHSFRLEPMLVVNLIYRYIYILLFWEFRRHSVIVLTKTKWSIDQQRSNNIKNNNSNNNIQELLAGNYSFAFVFIDAYHNEAEKCGREKDLWF